jgi:hypothetical protein
VHTKDIPHIEDIEAFCKELMTGELEGLCNCTHEDINLYIEEEKIDKCYQLIPVPREYDHDEICSPFTSIPAYKLQWPWVWIKEWQQYESQQDCSCPVPSSSVIEWNPELSNPLESRVFYGV